MGGKQVILLSQKKKLRSTLKRHEKPNIAGPADLPSNGLEMIPPATPIAMKRGYLWSLHGMAHILEPVCYVHDLGVLKEKLNEAH